MQLTYVFVVAGGKIFSLKSAQALFILVLYLDLSPRTGNALVRALSARGACRPKAASYDAIALCSWWVYKRPQFRRFVAPSAEAISTPVAM